MVLSVPIFVRTWVVIGIFAVALIGFHAYWVWMRPLSKVGWKKVDYLWLGLAIISLIGYVTQSRGIVAGYLLRSATIQMDGAYRSLSSTAEMYDNDPAICRSFVRSPYSPPEEEFQRSQHEFNVACDWFDKVAKAILHRDRAPNRKVSWTDLPATPTFTEPMLKNDLGYLQREVDHYNTVVTAHDEIEAQTHRSILEEVLVVLMPIFFAIALALRITKVTGEIKLERRAT
jgi:hypothetical protein